MNNGWISLNRKITNNWLWKDKPFSKGQAWIDILLMVNHKENKVLFRDELINVERGERITSQVKLSDRWGWSRGKVRKFLTMLESDNMLVVRTDKRKTVLKVVNYNVYQDNNNSKSQQTEQEKDKRTSKRKTREKQETEQEATTNNNVNNENNDNNKKKINYKTCNYTDLYKKIFDMYPREGGKRQGMINFYNRLKEHSEEELINTIKAYKKAVKKKGTDKEFTTKISNFFGEKAVFEDYLNAKKIKKTKVIPGKTVEYGQQEAFY